MLGNEDNLDMMLLGTLKVVRTMMKDVTRGLAGMMPLEQTHDSTCRQTRRISPYNALFSTCTRVRAGMDGLKLSYEVS